MVQLADDIATDKRRLDALRELSGHLLQLGDDVEVASLAARLAAQTRRLQTTHALHDVAVCSVKFRPSTTSTAAERAGALGKLLIFDVGQSARTTGGSRKGGIRPWSPVGFGPSSRYRIWAIL